MDFMKAIAAHQLWKTKLRVLIDGRLPEKIDPNHLGKDDQCELGKWLNTEGMKTLGHKPEFQNLVAVHKNFHTQAALVARKALTGDKAEATRMLDDELYKVSSTVVLAISRCKDCK